MKTKNCKHCKKELPANNQYFHNYHRAKDGLYGVCKTCRKQYFQTKHGSKIRIENDKKTRKRNPQKHRAIWIVNSAVKRGILPRVKSLMCVLCKGIAQDYHHWSYDEKHLLDVIPVCKTCHKKIHYNNDLLKQVELDYKNVTFQTTSNT